MTCRPRMWAALCALAIGVAGPFGPAGAQPRSEVQAEPAGMSALAQNLRTNLQQLSPEQQENLEYLSRTLKNIMPQTGANARVTTALPSLRAQTQTPMAIPRTARRLPPPPQQRGRLLKVDWDEVSRHVTARSTEYRSMRMNRRVAADKWTEPLIPVALPSGTMWTEQMVITPRPWGYIASAAAYGLTVEIQGTRLVDELPRRSRVARMLRQAEGRRGDVLINIHEYGIDASATMFGINFDVSILCDNPEDERCRDPGYVRDLVKNMLVVGGSRPMEE